MIAHWWDELSDEDLLDRLARVEVQDIVAVSLVKGRLTRPSARLRISRELGPDDDPFAARLTEIRLDVEERAKPRPLMVLVFPDEGRATVVLAKHGRAS